MQKIFIKTLYYFAFLILFSGICFSEVYTGEVTEAADGGIINYSTGIVKANGVGAPPEDTQNAGHKRSMAKVAAVTAARKNLLQALKKVRIDSETTIGNLDTRSEIIAKQIDIFIENSQEVAVKENSDGSVEVTVEISLRGQVSRLLFKNMGSLIPTGELNLEQTYTGLIVDCTGLGLKAAMLPKILDESGKEIYGSSYVFEKNAFLKGIAGYTYSLASAVKDNRVGTNPIVVKGLIPEGIMQVNVIIKNSSAENLEVINRTHTLFRECRVIFVI